MVFAIDRRDGRTLWEHIAWTGEPEPSHRMNGHASATCATNGKVVVAFFGKGGLHAYSLDGKPLWSRDLGAFDGPWGTAASPIFYGDMVIQNCDSESPESCLMAVDYRTGETVWQTPRQVIRGWSTPIVITTPEREELILNSHEGVRGYDPKTGAELWSCQGFNGRGEPVPAYAHGLLLCRQRPVGRYLQRAARRLGRRDRHASHLAHAAPRGPRSAFARRRRRLSAGLQHARHSCSATTAPRGKELWKERIGPKYASTPLVAEGRAYFLSEEGRPIVVEPGAEMKIVAESKLASDSDELFRAAIVPCQGQLFIRSSKFLYCIGAKNDAAAD